jgi:AcrR family transcriptional regulator
MYVKGVNNTTLDDVIATSAISKSQLYHYFQDKTELVRGVVELVGKRLIDRETASLSRINSLGALRRWGTALVRANAPQHGAYGCAIGSLANEVADQDAIAREALAALFEAWRSLLTNALRRCADNGALKPEADPEILAAGLLAALQGGYLLAQTAHDVKPMQTALDMAFAHIESYASDRRQPAREPAKRVSRA